MQHPFKMRRQCRMGYKAQHSQACRRGHCRRMRERHQLRHQCTVLHPRSRLRAQQQQHPPAVHQPLRALLHTTGSPLAARVCLRVHCDSKLDPTQVAPWLLSCKHLLLRQPVSFDACMTAIGYHICSICFGFNSYALIKASLGLLRHQYLVHRTCYRTCSGIGSWRSLQLRAA